MRSNSEQNTNINSLIPYYLASSGQLNELKEYLIKYPDIINKGWDGVVSEYGDQHYGTPLIGHATKALIYSGYSSAMLCVAVVSSAVNPLLFLGLGVASLFGGITGSIALESGYIKTRKGLNLLDFAAETGQTEIGLFLLSNGAELGKSLEIAAQYKRYNFITIISNEVEKMGKNKQLTNKLSEMQGVIKNLTHELDLQQINTPINQFYLDKLHEVIKNQMLTINLFMEKFNPDTDLEDILDINQKNQQLGNEFNKKYAELLEGLINQLAQMMNDKNKISNLDLKQRYCTLLTEFGKEYQEHCEKSGLLAKPTLTPNPHGLFSQQIINPQDSAVGCNALSLDKI